MNQNNVITLTEQQQAALKTLRDWWKSDSQNIIIRGKPGVGKTFLLKYFAESNKDMVPLFTAPTNEAVKQLELALSVKGKAKTTYSALGLKMSDWTKTQYIYQDRVPEDLGQHNVLVVDEASMVGLKLDPEQRNLLADYVLEQGIRTIWLGDDCQLPPVEAEDGVSPIFKQDWPQVFLTQVMRHSGAILDYVNLIRDEIPKPVRNLPKLIPGIEEVSQTKLRERLLQTETFDRIRKGTCKTIVWTNKRCDEINSIIRQHMFGDISSQQFLLPEDQILFIKPLFQRKGMATVKKTEELLDIQQEIICSINTKAQVVQTNLTMLLGVECWKVQFNLEDGVTCFGYHPTLKGLKTLKANLKAMHEAAQALPKGKLRGQQYKLYHAYKDCFCEVKHSYCITGHRSQGSTIDHVFVDTTNMLLNRDRLVAFKNLYVACSRAKQSLTLVRGV